MLSDIVLCTLIQDLCLQFILGKASVASLACLVFGRTHVKARVTERRDKEILVYSQNGCSG